MKIAILKERRPHESRVAGSPDSVKKLRDLGAEVAVEAGAGDGASVPDDAFKAAGAQIAKGATATLKGADIVLKVQRPMLGSEGTDEVGQLAKGQVLISLMSALTEPALVTALAKQGVAAFAMELVPRITRAQSMDVLSSQANLAGYKAVLDALNEYHRVMPMMMTAAGTIAPAKVLVMGAGVAGLQAIATAKRLSAVVSGTDVRPDTKEQVESLGGSFVAVEDEEFQQAQTAGGYAKEMSDAYKQKQAALIAETITKMDIVITTAQIPGRKSPVLVTEDMVKTMRPGAVINDLAVEGGGNCPLSEFGKVVNKHGVTIIGHANVPARVSQAASQLYARNLLNFLTPMIDQETGTLKIDTEDEIVAGSLVTRDGAIVNERVAEAVGSAGKPAARKPARRKAAPKAAKTEEDAPAEAADDGAAAEGDEATPDKAGE